MSKTKSINTERTRDAVCYLTREKRKTSPQRRYNSKERIFISIFEDYDYPFAVVAKRTQTRVQKTHSSKFENEIETCTELREGNCSEIFSKEIVRTQCNEI